MRTYQMLQSERNDLEDKLVEHKEDLASGLNELEIAREHGDLSENSDYCLD